MRAARFLLSHAADINVTTDEGWIPLHGLALHCDLDESDEVADLANDLIACGVDPEGLAPISVEPMRQQGCPFARPALGLPFARRDGRPVNTGNGNPARSDGVVLGCRTGRCWHCQSVAGAWSRCFVRRRGRHLTRQNGGRI